ncbi:MAG: hypothetical protein RIC16_10360 [Rhodospirillales bacterium]
MRKVERLPFTVYDIVGYLAPGAATVWLIGAIAKWTGSASLLGFKPEHIFLFGNDALDVLVLGVVFLVAAYGVGYIVSYLSAVFVERLIIYDLGYPSGHLMAEPEPALASRGNYVKDQQAEHGLGKKILVYFVMWPAMPVHLFALWTKWIYSELRPLPPKIRQRIRDRYQWSEAGGETLEQVGETEWFRVIEAYVLNNLHDVEVRSYNYVVIYGFIRSFMFIAVVSCWISATALITAFLLNINPFNLTLAPHGIGLATLFLFGFFAITILYFAYVKFFRRYSQETLNGFAMATRSTEERT